MRLPNDGCIKRVHVNQRLLRRAVAGEDVYPYTVQYKGKSHPCYDVIINGPSRAINAIQTPLSCGARLYIQTTGEVLLND